MRRPYTWAASGTILSLLFPLSNGLFLPPDAIKDSLPLSNYDYIVVGGGPSGLTVATRLSEDANVNVLLLEAGVLDTRGNMVTVPADIGDDLGSNYDWSLKTVGQEYLNGQPVTINQGKVVGGGTVLNGMVWTRGSSRDYDAWDALNDENNRERRRWQWEDLEPYFQKSENYSMDVDPSMCDDLHIEPDMSVHGNHGPVQVAYPRYIYQQSVNFLQGMMAMGVPIMSEPNNGTGDGAFIAPSSMSAQNQSRSDGRAAYLDEAIDRPNLHVATEQMVTRILLEGVATPDGNNSKFRKVQQAVGVEFASSAQSAKIQVNCTREVILAAGAIFSPTLLQISGIGPRAVLEPLDIPVTVDLPGVGANLQDHGMIHPQYTYQNSSLYTAQRFDASDAMQQAELEEYFTNRTGPLTAPLISTIAFPSLRHFAEDWVSLLSDPENESETLASPPDTDPAVSRGYAAQRGLQLPLLRDPTEGAVEVLADSVGTLSLAMQRPLSRGTVRPRSPDIFDGPGPLVDPRYCADPFDCVVLARALLFNCALVHTPPMAELQPVVQAPYFCPDVHGAAANVVESDRDDMDAKMLDLVKRNLVTEFHPSGTTAMLPLDLGGVVDTDLMVYGTNNLRVVDAGVMPMVLGAHLQAVVYAIAERAADIIKEVGGDENES